VDDWYKFLFMKTFDTFCRKIVGKKSKPFLKKETILIGRETLAM